jgi:GDP-4-dehydro-6-deoxy-D-mannose reductase
MPAGERVLITGVCGFSGRHLVERLRAEGSRILTGTDLAAAPRTKRLDDYLPCDLTDASSLAKVVVRARPDTVFHLAGRIGVAPAEEMQRANVDGFSILLGAVRDFARSADRRVRVLTVGSAAELGTTGARQLPVREEAHCAPESPYGRSKWEATRLALSEPPDSPLTMIVARPFNLVGPGLSAELSMGTFARQVAAVASGKLDAVRCGRLDTRRDYVDVRDAVNAYALLADRARPGLYHVCAGQSYLLAHLLQMLVEIADVPVPVLSDAGRSRPGDLLDIYGDHSKITREVAWQPAVPIRQSLADLLASVTS